MNLGFRQQSVGETTYLVFDIDDNLAVDSFAMQMMAHNRMIHIVQTQIVQINERRQIQFNITGLAKLNNRIAVPRAKKEILGIFGSILNAFDEVDAYMLDMDRLFLDWEYIYMDGQGNCMLMYLPFPHTFSKDKIVFLQEIVSRVQPDYQEKDPYLYDILNTFSRGAIQKLSDFREIIKKSAGTLEDGHREKVTEEKMEYIPETTVSKSLKKDESTVQEEIRKPEKKVSTSSKIPIINIPGREPGAKEAPPVPVREPEKKEPEKKKKGFFKRDTEKQKSQATLRKQKTEGIAIPDHANKRQSEMYESYEHTVIMQESVDMSSKDEGTVILEQSAAMKVSAGLIRKQDGTVYRIDRGEVVIGSGSAANICISNNNAISRRHAVIGCVNGDYYIEDNDSKNGSYVNGRRLNPRTRESLYAGMILRFANEDFEFFKD